MASIVLPAKAGVANEPSSAKAAVASNGRWISFRMDFMDWLQNEEKHILHEKKLIKPRVSADLLIWKTSIAPKMGGF
jgi:hypothetical protein